MSVRIEKHDETRLMSSGVDGFSLIEVAVVIFVIALVVGGLLVPLATQVEQRQISDTEKTLSEIRDALLGFAAANGHLPCPDKNLAGGAGIANDGVEDVDTGGNCVVTNPAGAGGSEGNLPWVTLGGIGATDVWGNRFRYVVAPEFGRRTPSPLFNLSSPGTIVVCTKFGCPAGTNLTPTAGPNRAVAIIISLGKNGRGAINALGVRNPDPPNTSDEYENSYGPGQFASRTITAAGSAAGEFDDIVVWLSKHTLFNRMIAAGKLP